MINTCKGCHRQSLIDISGDALRGCGAKRGAETNLWSATAITHKREKSGYVSFSSHSSQQPLFTCRIRKTGIGSAATPAATLFFDSGIGPAATRSRPAATCYEIGNLASSHSAATIQNV